MTMQSAQRFSIGELAELAGISRRAIRYYVQRGLIHPPLGAGRGHYYVEEHLQRLLSIKLLQDRGLTLEGIEQHLSESLPRQDEVAACASSEPTQSTAGGSTRRQASEGSPPDLSLWTRVIVAEGIELNIEGGRYRLSPARLLKLWQAVKAIIGDPFPPERDTETGEDDNG